MGLYFIKNSYSNLFGYMRFLITSKLVFLLLSGPVLTGQNKYWVYHQNEEEVLAQFNLSGPENCSEWLSACTYFLNKEQVGKLKEAGFEVDPALSFTIKTTKSDVSTLGFALEQVEAQHFTKRGLTGKGIKIGIIDGGFLKANEEDNLSHLFEHGLVKGYRDYVTPDMEPFGGPQGVDDDHGTEVWKLIGGMDEKKGVLFGLATEAEYYLARTDHGGYERRIEEDFFIAALEWMDSIGVRLINVSLGYNIGFTDPKENYKTYQMDGKTSAIARAVEIAAMEKGILIVVAAGNEGVIPNWLIVSTPGDAEHALTVGSSKFQVWDKMNFSSIGPEFLDYVKPDISIYSTNGTSYSTPIATGMAACLWQMDTTLTNMDIIGIFQKAGNFFPYPNNYLGYGVPTCTNILKVMEGDEREGHKVIRSQKDVLIYQDDFSERYLVVFHKREHKNVISRVVYRPLGKKVKIKRVAGAVQSSLLIGKEVIEIFWE